VLFHVHHVHQVNQELASELHVQIAFPAFMQESLNQSHVLLALLAFSNRRMLLWPVCPVIKERHNLVLVQRFVYLVLLVEVLQINITLLIVLNVHKVNIVVWLVLLIAFHVHLDISLIKLRLTLVPHVKLDNLFLRMMQVHAFCVKKDGMPIPVVLNRVVHVLQDGPQEVDPVFVLPVTQGVTLPLTTLLVHVLNVLLVPSLQRLGLLDVLHVPPEDIMMIQLIQGIIADYVHRVLHQQIIVQPVVCFVIPESMPVHKDKFYVQIVFLELILL